MVTDPGNADVIKTNMNAVLKTFRGDMSEELTLVFEHYFGTNSAKQKATDLYRKINPIMNYGASCFVIGFPLCRYDLTTSVLIDRLKTGSLKESHWPRQKLPGGGSRVSRHLGVNHRSGQSLTEVPPSSSRACSLNLGPSSGEEA